MEIGGDIRGQSVQIGAILMFAILIISFSTYQAVIVPNQNAEIEFNHFESVRTDMTDLRSAIYQAKTSGEVQSTTVTLGTGYPSRLVSLNPPPANGRLSAGEARNISMVDQDTGADIDIASRYSGIADSDEVYTRLLTYEPSYNVFEGGAPIRHEHSVLYLDYRETPQRGGVAIQNDKQKLVSDGRIQLVPIQSEYGEYGMSTVSVEPEPGILQTREFEDVNITVPTKLDEETWEELLNGEIAPEKVTVDEASEELTLELDGVWDVEYAPVGLDSAPPSGERGAAGSDINPASPGEIALISTARNQNNDEWELTFRNFGETTNFSEGRVNFYPGDASTLTQLDDDVATRDVSWTVGADYRTIDPEIPIQGDDQETTVTMGFDKVSGGDEWFVVSFLLESGEQATYFVAEGVVTSGSTQTLEAVESDGVTSSSNSLEFTIKNNDTQTATVTSFAVDATSIDDRAQLDDKNNAELQIDNRKSANRKTNDCANDYDGDGDCVFFPNGTTYSLDKTADIDPGASVPVELRAFEATSNNKQWPDDSTVWKFTDTEADADVVITLGLSDGTEANFYLKTV